MRYPERMPVIIEPRNGAPTGVSTTRKTACVAPQLLVSSVCARPVSAKQRAKRRAKYFWFNLRFFFRFFQQSEFQILNQLFSTLEISARSYLYTQLSFRHLKNKLLLTMANEATCSTRIAAINATDDDGVETLAVSAAPFFVALLLIVTVNGMRFMRAYPCSLANA